MLQWNLTQQHRQSLVQTNNKTCHVLYHSTQRFRRKESQPEMLKPSWSQLRHICIIPRIYNSNYTPIIYLRCLILTVHANMFHLVFTVNIRKSTDNATDFRYDLSCICIKVVGIRAMVSDFMIVHSTEIILGLQFGTWDVPDLWEMLVDLSVTTKQLKHVSIL